MKKFLLLGALAACSLSSMALVDNSDYPTFPVEGHDFTGYTFTNKWICARNFENYNGLYADQQARTACVYIANGVEKIIGSASPQITVGEESVYTAFINVWDFKTGTYEGQVQLSLNGAPITGQLVCNQVGVDDFGHLWFTGYHASLFTEAYGATKVKVYHIKDIKTGECEVACEVELPEDEAESTGRIDYTDILGDIYRQQAGCTLVSALNADAATVVGWVAEQGSDKWEGAFDDYVAMVPTDTYPADQTSWGTAPVAKIVKNDDYEMEMVYVDGFTTCPSLYTTDATMIDSFAAAVDLAPKPGTNGVAELTLNDDPFLIYSLAQYDVEPGCQASIAMLGDGMAFEGMQKMWDFPVKGLGTTGDSGTRVHALDAVKYTDANGVEGAYILTYKCYNGLGVYVLAPEGWEDPNGDGGVNDVIADNDVNAPVEYFNLQGVRVNNPAAGQVVIARQGSKVAKQLVK